MTFLWKTVLTLQSSYYAIHHWPIWTLQSCLGMFEQVCRCSYRSQHAYCRPAKHVTLLRLRDMCSCIRRHCRLETDALQTRRPPPTRVYYYINFLSKIMLNYKRRSAVVGRHVGAPHICMHQLIRGGFNIINSPFTGGSGAMATQ